MQLRTASSIIVSILLLEIICIAPVFALTPLDITSTLVPAKYTSTTGQFMAGAATVDITPQPGVLPRAGYSVRSTIGDGFRTRLFARAYYLKSKQGQSHLFIQTDLATGSRVLHTTLGEMLARETDIDTSRLTIFATHTHSAPGQFVGSNFYNRFISNKAGFAQGYFDFLVAQLFTAAKQAIHSQQAAKIAIGRRAIWGLTRNRSQLPHVQNHTVVDKSLAAQKSYHRVNPYMYMLRIDRQTVDGSLQPLASFASFSIHGTALPENERLFNADVWAYIHKDWEQFILEKYNLTQPVHVSAFEGVHGDVAPATPYKMLGYLGARNIGQKIASQAIALYQSLATQLTDQVTIASSMRYINLRTVDKTQSAGLCNKASMGLPMTAAPEEHTTPIIGYLPLFKQGSRKIGKERDNCQGRKRHTLSTWFQGLIAPQDEFPDFVLFQWVKINNLSIVPMPFEITTEAGRRIENSIANVLNDDSASTNTPLVMLSSVANGYTGYATTPEEYDRQFYEGGHTLYGKYTQPFLSQQITTLISDSLSAEKRIVDLPQAIHYKLKGKYFYKRNIPANGKRTLIKKPYFTHPYKNQEGFWRFEYLDVNASKIELHKPLVQVQRLNREKTWVPLQINNILVDDQRYDLAVRLIKHHNDLGMSHYAIEWYNPVFNGPDQVYRFAILPRGGLPVWYSPAFN